MNAPQNDTPVGITDIDGLFIIELTVRGDNRGWFKENWHAENLAAGHHADFRPVQNNISFNSDKGVTRGLHAEPWDKYISVASGSVFGAWCDLRENSSTYGKVVTHTITPGVAVYVPRGVANGFQALEDATAYTYLVNDHWSPHAEYSFVNLADPALGIDWPLPITQMSEKDRHHPLLVDAVPVPAKKILITGADGQLGRALRDQFPTADFATRRELDITDAKLKTARRWRDYSTIINAAAYTNVDQAEAQGRSTAWAINATGVASLSRIAADNDITLIHISSDYVFDGEEDKSYTENAPLCPLGVYGQSKAAGDVAATTAPKHYLIRTSWVIGDGKNFIRTMSELDTRGIHPKVVDDQIGRPSFTIDIAMGIAHLLKTKAPFGTYNLTNSGAPTSWADLAREVFSDPTHVTGVSTEEYFADKDGAALRPRNSLLSLDKICATGYTPANWVDRLNDYLERLDSK